MLYRVKLDIFEGPFDLLLFLIRKNEVDIYDIPIAQISEQFLAYIETMQMLDLDVAGDFIEMCAILISIKARYLLPKPESENEDEYDDPRMELVERLLEYKKYKEASIEMQDLEEQRSRLYSRAYFDYIPKTEEISDEAYLDNVNIFDLMMALKSALDNMPKVTEHQVELIRVTVEEQSDWILRKLTGKPMILFRELMQTMESKMEIIVTFIALLELMKKRLITVHQSENFDDIRIKPAVIIEEE
ncbi:MAG: hypothetical protein D6677_02440 [Calditrichaeota bacterium]|nr:MAG: hypothetical protein D6677_02440 [Calditrichota bacterium]